MTSAPVSPRLDRTITLTFQGDWGQANLHRICGWLAQEIGDRSGPGSRFGIWNGRGGSDAVSAVLDGQVDLALLVPSVASAMIAKGTGPLSVPGTERLRALGTLPQRDRLVTCVDSALGVETHEQLVDMLPQLTVATSPADGVNLVGLAAHRLLRAAGVELGALEAAGGRFLYSEFPFPAIRAFALGEANVLIHEAIMMPAWQRVANVRPVRYLDVSQTIADSFAEWAWPTACVDRGYLPGLERDLTALEFSDFILFCREDLPDDVAALVAYCLTATRSALEVQYRHLPPDRSPVTYPLQPSAISTTHLRLHPAAAQMYSLVGDAVADQALIWA